MITSGWALLVLALAAMRLTRIVTTDAITETLRVKAVAKLGGIDSKTHKLLSCNWCTGFWISCALAVAWYFYQGPWLYVPLLALALAQAVGLASRLDR